LTLVTTSFLCQAGEEAKKSQIIFPEQGAVIGPASLPELERQAMAGSREAAHRLATYYAMIKLDNPKATFWTEIRVENGDKNARYDLGARLAVEDDQLSKIRARYWLNQVISDGPPELVDLAKSALQSLDDRERYRKTH
ncbi:MAG TPA: hypothetical protein VFA65_19845, partial [Bryobacteraceae bacterium]|nr:hypothetical protein [Bryobacteraceae bacterium]